MKRSLQVSALAMAIAMSSTFVFADTIVFGSYATGASSLGNSNTATNFAGFNTSATPSTGTGSSFTLNPSNVWAGPILSSTWVGSAANAGPVGTSNPAIGYYTFTTNFTASSTGPYSGSLSLLADDTAEVLLNGNVLLALGALGADTHCSASNNSCLGVNVINLSGISLLAGTNANTLTFVVQQAGSGLKGGSDDPSGVDFQGTLSSPVTTSPVPEMSTLMLMGTGLFGLAGSMYRRMRQ